MKAESLLKRRDFIWRLTHTHNRFTAGLEYVRHLNVSVSVSSCSDGGRLFQDLDLAHRKECSPNFRHVLYAPSSKTLADTDRAWVGR